MRTHIFAGEAVGPQTIEDQDAQERLYAWVGEGQRGDALVADADTLSDDQRGLIEEARTVRDVAVAQVRELVTTLRASMDEQEGSA